MLLLMKSFSHEHIRDVYIYLKCAWHWGEVQLIVQYDLHTTEGTWMTRLVAVVRT